MADETNVNEIITTDLFGRRTIFTSVSDLTPENVISEVNSALVIHLQNMCEEEKLYWFRRGVQPILNRTKERNEFINNKVVVNHAEEIVSFKNGYFMTQPAYYIARKDGVQDKVNRLNEYLYRSGKLSVDNSTIDWFHTVGLGYIYVEPNNGDDAKDTPFKAYALRPQGTFVAYSTRPGNEPVYAANAVTEGDRIYLDVYTKTMVYRLNGTYKAKLAATEPESAVTAINVISAEPNIIGEIPIIEYRYNSTNMSSFEPVVGLLDELNNILSNRADGVEQFIQSLLVLTNCQIDDDDANDIRTKGMLMLRSISELPAKVELLSEQLDQQQTQTFVEDIFRRVLSICGMPSQATNSSTYDTTGAAVMANFGWYQADAFARNTEDLFRESNRRFDKVILKILEQAGLMDIDINDFEVHFVRNETANIQSKAQAFQTLMASGMHPVLAAQKSGVSNDPMGDMAMSEKYLKMIWGDPNKPEEEAGEQDGSAVGRAKQSTGEDRADTNLRTDGNRNKAEVRQR